MPVARAYTLDELRAIDDLAAGRTGGSVVTIDGKEVRSDKAVREVVTPIVYFEDGSWCNVQTGEVVNNGPGSIRIINPNQATEETTLGPTLYSANALEVRAVQADVEVVVNEGSGCEVTMTGPENELKAIKVTEQGGMLIIQGERAGANDVTIISGGGSIRAGRISSGSVVVTGRGISISGGNVVSIGGSRGANKVKITVTVPKGAAVELTDVDGKIAVGDTEGALRLTVSGEANVRVGRIGRLRARLSGASQMDIRHVTGDANIHVSGTGDITIDDGDINELNVGLSGMGSVTFGGTAQDADLSVSGMGNVHVATVVNRPHRSVSGMGRITVGNWR